MAENAEIPPTPKTPSDLKEKKSSRGQAIQEVKKAEVSSHPIVVANVDVGGEKPKEAPKDASQTKSKGIFAGTGALRSFDFFIHSLQADLKSNCYIIELGPNVL